ncbi:MAG: glycosyltransferase family 2 protein [Planctomycetes bacterium]|nr:glycosyltransferase family 2 protein [Planctomycetota bacterium]
MKTCVVIPAFDEERSIPLVLAAIPRDLAVDAIVVDNASADGTAEAARRAGARVVREERRGYGSACLRGIAELPSDAECVVFLDADFSDHPEEMALLVEPIRKGEADLVIGSRMLGAREPGALLPQAYLGNKLACLLIRLFWGFRYTDLGPFRAIRRDALARLRMRDRDFGWTVEMQVRAIQEGLRIVERPVSYRRRVGVSKITGTLSGTVKAGAKILWTVGRLLLRAP